jgi:glucose uptake protein|tara:strand:- start:605 stop:1519 length:915 start_codon:yes stop_codon:yes gene_type:complete
MEGIIFAFITVLAWGSWIAPSQNIPLKGQQTRTFYTSIAVLILGVIVAAFLDFEGLNSETFFGPVIGGLLWAFSCWFAFVGVSKIGMAKAFGIWAPMNVIVGITWGIVLRGEFIHTSVQNQLIALLAVVVMIGGIVLIVFSGDSDKTKVNKKDKIYGLLGTAGAGIGFASYFIPINMATDGHPDFSMWVGTFPLAIGMFIGSIILVVSSKSSLKLEKGRHYPLILLSGVLWAIGNYGALVMMKPENLGTGQGFAVAQLCMVVNAILGIYIFKTPKPRTKAANLTLLGVFIAAIGGAIFGYFVNN